MTKNINDVTTITAIVNHGFINDGSGFRLDVLDGSYGQLQKHLLAIFIGGKDNLFTQPEKPLSRILK